jgi:hypothetical protein
MLLDLESGNIAVKPTPHVHPCIGTPPVPVQDICDQSQKTCAGSGYVLVRGAKESGKTSLLWTSGRPPQPMRGFGDIAAGVQVEWGYGYGARLVRNLTDRQLALLRPKVKPAGSRRRVFYFWARDNPSGSLARPAMPFACKERSNGLADRSM